MVRLRQFPAGLRQFSHAVADAASQLLCCHPDLRRAGRAVLDRADRQRPAPGICAARAGACEGGDGSRAMTGNGILIGVMAFLFLFLGYLGVPVPFAILAGVFVATAFTPISLPSIVGQLFNGIDSEALLAVP